MLLSEKMGLVSLRDNWAFYLPRYSGENFFRENCALEALEIARKWDRHYHQELANFYCHEKTYYRNERQSRHY